jgi:hypothetical protein
LPGFEFISVFSVLSAVRNQRQRTAIARHFRRPAGQPVFFFDFSRTFLVFMVSEEVFVLARPAEALFFRGKSCKHDGSRAIYL